MLKCKSCNGEYNVLCNDGLYYFHACPPVEVSENVFVERQDKRDENPDKKMEGKGFEEVTVVIK